ncbi:hypothetical protein BCV69DRAFT_209920 [Microstroma glucosiphilum]|uniref:Glyoxalase-like domain-containing protein n=1 Tax=Pseudomicrostroma glucosiphilum TaxID=1684307 RepID=A0A316U6J4_9BASI|nr:hypothetical protein BCV69DRAFT_209920 [Pseudomicrostroma glucosiphilum]PWN20438.1 hypothetical protein BCV69DRAFT_209920 [Pseudomicrostroma glucosiphilum]
MSSLPMPALDHLIHLHPSVAAMESSIALYSSLGFLVTRGGNHADLLTTNALIVLPDGVYIELIAFLEYEAEGVDRGGETRQEWQLRREQHWWSGKKEGWIDWCLAGGVADGQVEASNARAQEQAQPLLPTSTTGATSPGLYKSPRAGGRTTLRGDQIKWKVTFPDDALTSYALPFWCEDVTPRSLRVPSLSLEDEGSAQNHTRSPKRSAHPNGALGIHSLLFLFNDDDDEEERFEEAVKAWSLLLPRESQSDSDSDSTFLLSTPSAAEHGSQSRTTSSSAPIKVQARHAQTKAERDWLAQCGGTGALYEVELRLQREGEVDRTASSSSRRLQEAGERFERLRSERERELGLGRMKFWYVA